MFYGRFKSAVKEYFNFNTRERKGIIILLLIIIANLFVQFYLKYYTVPPEFKYEELELESMAPDSIVQNFIESNNSPKIEDFNNSGLSKLRNFDPNTIDSLTLAEFGFNEKLISTFINYRKKGGRFYKKEDVAKIYGISNSRYEELYPYIQIKNTNTKSSELRNYSKPVKTLPELFELNSVDTIQLKQLPFIGPGRARMIVNYRNALGGYHNIEQLLEVYTIDSLVYFKIHDRFYLDTSKIVKVNLNDDKIKHPYLDYNILRSVKSYRIQHGNFQHIEELQNIKLVDVELYNKLAPYVTIE